MVIFVPQIINTGRELLQSFENVTRIGYVEIQCRLYRPNSVTDDCSHLQVDHSQMWHTAPV